MNPSFAMIQLIVRDHEEELRREANRYHNYAAAQGVPRPLPSRLANVLRLLANRLDPEPAC